MTTQLEAPTPAPLIAPDRLNKYRLRKGERHTVILNGQLVQYEATADEDVVLEMTAEQFNSFRDKFEPVVEESAKKGGGK